MATTRYSAQVSRRLRQTNIGHSNKTLSLHLFFGTLKFFFWGHRELIVWFWKLLVFDVLLIFHEDCFRKFEIQLRRNWLLLRLTSPPLKYILTSQYKCQERAFSNEPLCQNIEDDSALFLLEYFVRIALQIWSMCTSVQSWSYIYALCWLKNFSYLSTW